MGVVYKITNRLNNKVYIGLTTVSLAERWRNHKASVGRVKRHLYFAMEKYGVENFSIEELDSADDPVKLGKLERKYIKEYNSTDYRFGYNNTFGGETNQLDGNPRARLTVEDIENIRKIYSEGLIGCKECWELYSDKISYSAFEKVYEGSTWKSIMPEVYTDENKKKHKRKFKSLPGEKNGNAILSDSEVMEIREYYVDHPLEECYKKFGNKFKTKASFRSVIDKSYLHLPVYSKIKKKWENKK